MSFAKLAALAALALSFLPGTFDPPMFALALLVDTYTPTPLYEPVLLDTLPCRIPLHLYTPGGD